MAPAERRQGEAFVWGPPRMRPARAQQALRAAGGKRGRSQLVEQQLPAGQHLPSIRVEVNQNNDEGDRIAPVNINIQLPETGASPTLSTVAPAKRVAPAAKSAAQRADLNSKSAVDEIENADGDAPARDAPAVYAVPEEHEAASAFSPEGESFAEYRRRVSEAPEGETFAEYNRRVAEGDAPARDAPAVYTAPAHNAAQLGDAVSPKNPGAEYEGESGSEQHEAASAFSPEGESFAEYRRRVSEAPEGETFADYNRRVSPEVSVSEDSSEQHEAAAAFSPDDPVSEEELGSDDSSEQHEAAAAFSPNDSGATSETEEATSSETAEAPALPAMWLVGSQGQPHPTHDDKATMGGAGGQSRSGKHAKDIKARADAAAKLQALRMSQLSQLSSAELRSDHMVVTATGAVVVPLPDLKTMPGRQLVALEQGLKFEEQDARDSATSMAGMDRAKALSHQIELVRARMQNLPVEIEKELAKNEVAIAKKQREIQVLKGDIEDEQQKLDTARKEAGPKKLRREERSMQAKVELQRAAASALADITGKSAPQFAKLEKGADATDDVDEASDQESIPDQAKELKLAQADLSSANTELAKLHSTRDSLLKDIAATHKALGGDAETDEYGNQVGGEEWLKQEEEPAKLAALRRGRATMLAEDEKTDTVAELMSNATAAWDKYMDENDPSHMDEGDVRHGLRKGIAQGGADMAAGVATITDGKWHTPDFKTIDPKHGVHTVHTPAKVKQLATKGVGVGKEGPKLQFCQWGSELVPCAPGYGGAWIGDHPQDSGIWGNALIPEVVKPRIREHVKAGKRSAPYLSDMFSYGKAGIFGARRQGGAAASGSVYKGPMLNGAKENQRKIKSSIPEVWGLKPQVRVHSHGPPLHLGVRKQSPL